MSQTVAMTTTGADLLVQTALVNGVDHCFANPGTTELHLVQALDRAAGMRSVLCAFEGVCSGAADSFARMTGRPALGLFHLGPGYANALANLHNARRHHTPMINVIGDQASWHLDADAPLTSDIDLLTSWTGRTMRTASADDTGRVMADAIASALSGTELISNVVVPADHAWGSATASAPAIAAPAAHRMDAELVSRAARHLQREGATLILGGARLSERALWLADDIRSATGCAVFTSRTARLELGRHVQAFPELPYFPQPLQKALADTTVAVLAGGRDPVTFFGYPDTPSFALPESAKRISIAGPTEDLDTILGALADELGVSSDDRGVSTSGDAPSLDPGTLGPRNLGQAFVRAIPENAIVVAEAISSGGGYRSLAHQAAPHTLLSVTGGAIGGGLPAAVGAAVACPDRPLLALQADGSALYTIQSLWTMARESLDVTVVICANRRYQILDLELEAAGIELDGAARSLTKLDQPAVDFVQVAAGFGVPAVSVSTGADLERALARATQSTGPNLIEAVL